MYTLHLNGFIRKSLPHEKPLVSQKNVANVICSVGSSIIINEVNILWDEYSESIKRSLVVIQAALECIQKTSEQHQLISFSIQQIELQLFIYSPLLAFKETPPFTDVQRQDIDEIDRYYLDISPFLKQIPDDYMSNLTATYFISILYCLLHRENVDSRKRIKDIFEFFELNVSNFTLDNILSTLHLFPELDVDNNLKIFLEQYQNIYNEWRLIDPISPKETFLRKGFYQFSIRRKLIKAFNCFLRHMIINTPYNRIEYRKAMNLVDTTERRYQCYNIIKSFDRQIESDNIKNVTELINHISRFSEYPMKLVVGRESRAFGNQAYLLANAKYVSPSEDLKNSVKELLNLSNASKIAEKIRISTEITDDYFKSEVENLIKDIELQNLHISSSLGKIDYLISLRSVPLTQYYGSIQNLKETLEIYHKKCFDSLDKLISNIENMKEEFIEVFDIDYSFHTAKIRSLLTKYFKEIHLKIDEIFKELNSLNHNEAAYSILLQRPSLTGSERFKLNELESKPEQEDALQKLVYMGGERLHMSPSYEWICHATDIIEAVPLFIYEKTIVKDHKPVTIFDVDQEGLEQTIRTIADYWAENIDLVMQSEHISLAREILVKSNEEYYEKLYERFDQDEDVVYLSILENEFKRDHTIATTIAKTSLWLSNQYRIHSYSIEKLIEKEWMAHNFITRLDSLRKHIPEDPKECLRLANEFEIDDDQVLSIQSKVFERRRRMPGFHLLTTEAPGLVEGFFSIVLEEEMAMRNIIKDYNLENEVNNISKSMKEHLFFIGNIIIDEYDYMPLVRNYVQSGYTEEDAMMMVISENEFLEEGVSILSVLLEVCNVILNHDPKEITTKDDVYKIEDKLYDQFIPAKQIQSIDKKSIEEVWNKNESYMEFKNVISSWCSKNHVDLNDFMFHEKKQIIMSSPIYEKEAFSLRKNYLRRKCIKILDKRYNLYLQDRIKSYFRSRTSLLKTTARRKCIYRNNLLKHLTDPIYLYSSGLQFEIDGTIKPVGSCKRYHLIYGPSRVNLGKDERKSVETWPQFIGVSDPLSAEHAYDFYSLINYNPVIRNIKEAENLKVSENQWTALVRSVRNVQALFVERVGMGDIEDLAYQFNMRGGLAFGYMKEKEGYNAGPTAGYCIPKDLLFKLFVANQKNDKTLSQIGIPHHVHSSLIDILSEISKRREDFETSVEWERWASSKFLDCDKLLKDNNKDKHLIDYIAKTETSYIFHPTRITSVLSYSGVPSPFMSSDIDYNSVLWSNWADHKITLGGEQVNRSLVFTMTRSIFICAEKARKLNPNVDISSNDQLFIQLHGVYKGDDDQPPPPDVRYSWTMRTFQILSGQYQPVMESLDEEGQIIARLCCVGFEPFSNNEKDIECTKYIAKKFLNLEEFPVENIELLDKFKRAFPPCCSVGDITVTVVPGVDSEDLLGYSAETLTLLGECADKAKAELEKYGMTENQMKANAILRRQFPYEWTPLNKLPTETLDKIKLDVGGSIHPLILRLRGPGTDFMEDVQGKDVCIFSITHPDILSIDPSHLRDLMLIGRPNSALIALDYVSQGRHVCWFDRDIMLWYAAGRRINTLGKMELDWTESHKNRKSIYKSLGEGTNTYKPILGTDLREEVVRQENRASILFFALKKIDCSEDSSELHSLIEEWVSLFKKLINKKDMNKECLLSFEYTQRLLLANRLKPRDKIIQDSLNELANGIEHYEFNEVHWLSIGGIYLINGTPEEYQQNILNTIHHARKKINKVLRKGIYKERDFETINHLIVPCYTKDQVALSEKKTEMFSVKASETSKARSITRRAELALQSILSVVKVSFTKGYESLNEKEEVHPLALSHSILKLLRTDNVSLKESYFQFGKLLRLTEQAITKFAKTNIQIETLQSKIIDQASNLTNLNEVKLNLDVFDEFCGTYENHGLISEMFSLFNVESEEFYRIMDLCELLYICLAVDRTITFISNDESYIRSQNIWRNLCEFFAKTINDHFYEYNPWFLDSKRGSTFLFLYKGTGSVKEEYMEWMYKQSWHHHRILYQYIRTVIIKCTDAKHLDHESLESILGDISIDENGDISKDYVKHIAIGNECIEGEYEKLWRGYNQLREISFMRNDGFSFPYVFNQFNPDNSYVLDSINKVNMVILSPVGRTHYSRMIMESSRINDNIIITRSGFVGKYEKNDGNVVDIFKIKDGHFWISEKQFEMALKLFKNYDDSEISKIISKCKTNGQLTPKGIRVAAKFIKDLIVGVSICFHHHPYEHTISRLLYPSTDKSPFLFDLTYNKSIYPFIYNQESNVLLPPEVDWYQSQTRHYLEKYNYNEDKVIHTIQSWLFPFIEQHPIIIVKGASESGARNLQRFDLKQPDQERIDMDILMNCSRFIFQISKSQNVTIQKAIISSPLIWMSKSAIDSFIEREIEENEIGVNIQTHPKDYVYGSLRIIMSSSVPPLDNLHDHKNWEASHKLFLASIQIATNVGRQGILEILSSDMIRPEWRDKFIKDLEEVGSFVMSATSKFGPTYWNEGLKPNKYEHILPFKERFKNIPEKDILGVPTWWPRYLMIDIIPEPTLINQEGRKIEHYSILEEDYENGQYVVMDERKVIHRCRVVGFKYYLLEPNVGIGLWPNYWKREVIKEKLREDYYNEKFSWDAVGLSDIKVLSNFIEAGRQFIKEKLNKNVEKAVIMRYDREEELNIASRALKNLNDQYGLYIFNEYNISLYIIEFLVLYVQSMIEKETYDPYETSLKLFKSIDKNIMKLDEIPSRIPASTVLKWLHNEKYTNRIHQLVAERVLHHSMAPPIQLSHDEIREEFIQKLCPYKRTLAIAFDQIAMISHQIHPFILGSYGSKYNIIGISTDWIIKGTSLAKRAIFYDSLSHSFIEGDLFYPISFDFIYFVQFSGKDEVKKHQYWCSQLEGLPVHIVNNAKDGSIIADNKLWIRQNLTNFSYPNYMVITDEDELDLLLIENFMKNYKEGIVLQPSSNTTESNDVYYFKSHEVDKVVNQAKSLLESHHSLLLSEFRGNICYEGKRLVLRLNVIMGNVTASVFVGNENENIVSLKKGYCPRLYKVLSNLQDASNGGEIINFNINHWIDILKFARYVYEGCTLPIIGIDAVLEYNSKSNEITPILLEVNCRPGSIIFGETPVFSEGILSGSVMQSPINLNFWNYLNSNKIDISSTFKDPSNLYEWKLLLSAHDYSHPYIRKLYSRYVKYGEKILSERIDEHIKLINNALRNGFSATKPFKVVASNGRDRYFCGHTDFDGLGGITINATNNCEILGIFQENEEEIIELTNSNQIYQPYDISIKEIYNFVTENDRFRKIYDPHLWYSYIQSALTYAFSSNFEHHEIIREYMFDSMFKRWKGVRAHFQSDGLLKLESENGNSSSSALTTCFMLGLIHLHNIPIPVQSLGIIDYCEYYLGKTAGAADATTILTSSPGNVSVISSFPDVRLDGFKLSPMISVMIVNTHIPRLNSSKGKVWLSKQGYRDDEVDRIYEWAKSVMNRFGSKVYVEGLRLLIESLNDKEMIKNAKISEDEAETVLKSLKSEWDNRYYLRELCWNGRLEKLNPQYGGWTNRFKRYNLIFRLLKLIPETAIIEKYQYEPRKAVLFGLAEVERGWYYVQKMKNMEEDDCFEIMNLIRWSHDGDRANVDYRKEFRKTPWAKNKRNNVSDNMIDQWISNESEELIDKPGGFERSLPEIDEWADELNKEFDGRAALRISAAGLGGCLCVHAMGDIAKEVEKWFIRKGCDVRQINPGPNAQVLN